EILGRILDVTSDREHAAMVCVVAETGPAPESRVEDREAVAGNAGDENVMVRGNVYRVTILVFHRIELKLSGIRIDVLYPNDYRRPLGLQQIGQIVRASGTPHLVVEPDSGLI